MRILWVKAGKLLPVDTGGKIRSYNLLRQLTDGHEVVLLSYYGGRKDSAYEEEIARRFPLAVTLHTAAPEGAAATSADYLLRLPGRLPYAVSKFTSKRVSRLIREWFGDARFDVAVCDFLSASANFPEPLTVPTVLFQHNVESALWRRQTMHERNWIKRAAFGIEARKMERYERAAVARFPHVVAVSESDRQLLCDMTEPRRVSVVPTGVDVRRYRPPATRTAGEPLVLFLGSLDWEANIDAVEFFCREIWPAVTAAVPEARFRVVGRRPHPRIARLASRSIDIVADVPSVVEHLWQAAVFVVPLRIGGGTRLKIYEAMAAGKAIVSTSVGAEGLDVEHERNIVIADAAPTFAASVAGLLHDTPRRHRLEAAASELVARYDWSSVAAAFEAVLRRAAGQTSPLPERAAVRSAPDWDLGPAGLLK